MDVTYFCFYLRVTRPDGCDSATHLDFDGIVFLCSTSVVEWNRRRFGAVGLRCQGWQGQYFNRR